MPIKNIIPGQQVAIAKLQRARALRQEMTRAEKALWQELRANKLGVHFRRQQIIAGFIVDFYCHECKLAIELDGNYHKKDVSKEYDKARTVLLNEYGITVLRFWNEEVIKDMGRVLNKISFYL